MENLEKLKEAVLKKQELKQDAHYRKIESKIRQCDEVIRAFTDEQKEILKPLARNLPIMVLPFLKLSEIKYLKSMG